jgi:hypothetical protein
MPPMVRRWANDLIQHSSARNAGTNGEAEPPTATKSIAPTRAAQPPGLRDWRKIAKLSARSYMPFGLALLNQQVERIPEAGLPTMPETMDHGRVERPRRRRVAARATKKFSELPRLKAARKDAKDSQ